MNQMAVLREFDASELLPGTRLLNGQYQILEPLQKGGFAMTYIARDSLDRNVVIKECFPAGLCKRRDGQVSALSVGLEAKFAAIKQQFVCEARGMAKLKHPYVVAVHQVFEENNTAYMALDYVDGIDLISVQEDEPERLTPAFLDVTLCEALKAVRHIHSKGVLHRDISPDNLRVDDADRITLIDFGAAGARDATSAFGTTALAAVKDGYSPPEFYWKGEVHDFSSDLYSLGATFYLLITGEVPPSGQLRREMVLSGHSDPYVPLLSGRWDCGYPLLVTIDMAMELDRNRRPQTADQWLTMLDELPRLRPAPRPVPMSDVELGAVVSRMVEDVNRNLTSEFGQVRTAEGPKRASGKDSAKKIKPEQWLDIFGNPIADVASWMIEQTTRFDPKPVEVVAEVSADSPEECFEVDAIRVPQNTVPVRKSLILGLIARCLSRRSESCLT